MDAEHQAVDSQHRQSLFDDAIVNQALSCPSGQWDAYVGPRPVATQENTLPWSASEAPASAKQLAAHVMMQRWFRGKSSGVGGLRILDTLPLSPNASIAILEVTSGARTDRYSLPLSIVSGALAGRLETDASPLVIERLTGGALLCDALADPEALSAILERFAAPGAIAGTRSTLDFERVSPPLPGGRLTEREHLVPHPLGVEQSNSSVVYGQRFILKILRLLDEGESADLEMARFLGQAGYTSIPRLEGSIRWSPRTGPSSTLGILQAFVPNDGGAWERTIERLAQLLAEHPEPPGDDSAEVLASHREHARTLGHQTAELHLALGRPTGNAAFEPEALTLSRQQQLSEAASTMLGTSLRLLRERKAKGGGHISLPLWAGEVVSRLRVFAQEPVGGMVTRVHGDLHLGQILESGRDVILVDFEGEPARSLAERRMKRSPLVDAAGVLRSYHYAATTAVRTSGAKRWESAWMSAWHEAVTATFRQTYFERMSGSGLLPPHPAARSQALNFFLLEKCLYELGYELDNRPDWVAVPMAGLKQLVEDRSEGS